jgi:hypothetical protein
MIHGPLKSLKNPSQRRRRLNRRAMALVTGPEVKYSCIERLKKSPHDKVHFKTEWGYF